LLSGLSIARICDDVIGRADINLRFPGSQRLCASYTLGRAFCDADRGENRALQLVRGLLSGNELGFSAIEICEQPPQVFELR
jgi:hypothetical protein